MCSRLSFLPCTRGAPVVSPPRIFLIFSSATAGDHTGKIPQDIYSFFQVLTRIPKGFQGNGIDGRNSQRRSISKTVWGNKSTSCRYRVSLIRSSVSARLRFTACAILCFSSCKLRFGVPALLEIEIHPAVDRLNNDFFTPFTGKKG